MKEQKPAHMPEVGGEDVQAVVDNSVQFICSLTGYGGQLQPNDIVHCFYNVLRKERQRLKQWADMNCWTEDNMITDLPENHQYLIDYHELLDELRD